jgi:hypothetical protein
MALMPYAAVGVSRGSVISFLSANGPQGRMLTNVAFHMCKTLIIGLYTANGCGKESHYGVCGIPMRLASAPGKNQQTKASLHVLIY